MTPEIAIVGRACRYADADSPQALWENVLAQRRAFRQLPAERLALADYASQDGDGIYAREAAVLDGWEFDRIRFKVAGSTFRSTDLSHWLALETAAAAFADAGFADGDGLPKDTTGVLVGNTLTGEFSRAQIMRLRWPYVRRVLAAALAEEGWGSARGETFLARLEASYKQPFAEMTEDSLAGGLANTIAGRIANYFDLHGGGYTVDGACASSLLALANACSALAIGDLDVAVAGGVDLSIDPFELVGFARTGALTPSEMYIYDVRSQGFIPGEGCGFLVLMRRRDAEATGRRVLATIRGWGLSSDGHGGITRPRADGQLLAIERAFARAGLRASAAAYFEGHGTGTPVGDATEIAALGQAVRRAGVSAGPGAALGSIKANIGHTKAASGAAGVIKAIAALEQQLLPPTTGCGRPLAELATSEAPLRPLRSGEPWPVDRPLVAGVSGMGFGGINVHLVLAGEAVERRRRLRRRERLLLRSAQDHELFLLSAADREALAARVAELSRLAPRLARHELSDLAASLGRGDLSGEVRAALVASRPEVLATGLRSLEKWLADGDRPAEPRVDAAGGVFLGSALGRPRVGLLFPGQGSPARADGGLWQRRFPELLGDLWPRSAARHERSTTATAQPAIVNASLAAVRLLADLGIAAELAIGHSLGELVALTWAGAVAEDAAQRIAAARGQAMQALAATDGAMLSLRAPVDQIATWIAGSSLVVAASNSPRDTVVAGPAGDIERLAQRARGHGCPCRRLAVSHAFHSPSVAPAAPRLLQALAREHLQRPRRRVVSTITGGWLEEPDLEGLLVDQISHPVRFTEALEVARGEVDLWLEAGPGSALTGLLRDQGLTAIALDAGGASLYGLLAACGAAYVLGSPLAAEGLFEDRFSRPFDAARKPIFLTNPCELAPPPPQLAADSLPTTTASGEPESAAGASSAPALAPVLAAVDAASPSPLDLVRRLVAERTELPLAAVRPEQRLLSDLHLSSLAVSQLVAAAGRALSLPPSVAPTEYADATVDEISEALAERQRLGGRVEDEAAELPAGVDSWVRAFTVERIDRELPAFRSVEAAAGSWQVVAPPDHPLRETLACLGGHGRGVALCLPPAPAELPFELFATAAEALRGDDIECFVVVQQGGPGGALARSLHLERPDLATCVVDLPFADRRAGQWICQEIEACTGWSEVCYDEEGRRRQPVLRPLAEADLGEYPIGAEDVLLVTGGGKGIGAECAYALARATGVRLAILGRSSPHEDAELATNLERLAAAQVVASYFAADVSDYDAVSNAVNAAQRQLGPVTAVLHAAGVNPPKLLHELSEDDFRRVASVKVDGARHLLAAIAPDQLRLFIAFGSIIARTGLPGEAHYGLANEALRLLVETLPSRCRKLVLEWSVWAGVGMGERLGRLEALARQGITAIPVDRGVEILEQLLRQRSLPTSVVVCGRLPDVPTLPIERPSLPLRRFLERPRAFYPGIELVVEVDLSDGSDPYLADHVVDGDRWLPGVIGLEAMAQLAMALVDLSELPVFERVRFHRPVSVPAGETVTLRLAALVRQPRVVDVVLRSSTTHFQADHFSARCRFAGGRSEQPQLRRPQAAAASSIVPESDLYSTVLFHRGRFRRVGGYRWLHARESVAEIVAARSRGGWFGRFLPQDLILGDPGARDAVIHSIQASIPHATVIPVAVERLEVGFLASDESWTVASRERRRDGDTLIYDVEVVDGEGRCREAWRGLELRAMARAGAADEPWAPALLGPYLERRIEELVPGKTVTVALLRGTSRERRRASDQALAQVLSGPAAIVRRVDGKPEVVPAVAGERPPWRVSTAHAADLVLAVAAPGPVACDLEPVAARPWPDLLAPRMALVRQIVADLGDREETAATRVWTALECLKKASVAADTPLAILSHGDGWLVLAAGELRLISRVLRIRPAGRPVAVALLVAAEILASTKPSPPQAMAI